MSINSKPASYAVIVPVGPTQLEIERVSDLLESVWTYEPQANLCVLIDDSPQDRQLGGRVPRPPNGDIISLVNPRRGLGNPVLGGHCTSILSCLRAIYDHGPVEMVIRLDSDALIIGSFSESIREFVHRHPDAGMIGTLGKTCRREEPDYGWEADAPSPLVVWEQGITDEMINHARENGSSIIISDLDPIEPEALDGFISIRDHIRLAMKGGYSWLEYCQGGAYVLNFEIVIRMAQRSYLDNPIDWVCIPVAEDVVLGMYARAVGMKIMDFSDRGQPFGVQHQGLAYKPDELLDRGHAIIHSVKNDRKYSEVEIRDFFWNVRTFPQRAPKD